MEKSCKAVIHKSLFICLKFYGRLCRAEWWRRGECAAPDEDDAFLGKVSLRMAWYANPERIWREIVVCVEGLLQGAVYNMAV